MKSERGAPPTLSRRHAQNNASVVIMGGGPAGSALGCYLSMAGIDNLIIEREFFPRAHVGESMVTSTTRIFEEIGFLETMEVEGFPRKFGASWHPSDRSGSSTSRSANSPKKV
jgi:1H-pyrrole-2-carbonyl-[peptidyl-carrier protein] chlorinase